MLAGEFAEINGDKYVAACSGLDEEALFASEAFETLKNALVDYAQIGRASCRERV